MSTGQRIPEGSTEYVGVLVTGPTGVDLTDDTVQLAVVDASDPSPAAPAWRTPDTLTCPTTSTVQARVLIGPLGAVQLAPGRYRVWVKVTDNPEVPWVPSADTFRVV
jgi:hypothetical protein